MAETRILPFMKLSVQALRGQGYFIVEEEIFAGVNWPVVALRSSAGNIWSGVNVYSDSQCSNLAEFIMFAKDGAQTTKILIDSGGQAWYSRDDVKGVAMQRVGQRLSYSTASQPRAGYEVILRRKKIID